MENSAVITFTTEAQRHKDTKKNDKMKNCKEIQPILIDFVDKTLNEENTEKVRLHLESCKSCSDEVDGLVVLFDEMNKVENEQPDESLKQNFADMLEAEKQKQSTSSNRKSGRKIWLQSPLGQVAAGFTILIAGMMLGLLFRSTSDSNLEVTALKSEVNNIKDMLILTKLDQPIASERIIAASYLEEMTAPDHQVLEALISTMNTDENANVRIAAMNALAKFKNQPLVRDALVETLSVQTDPIIQISLINILVGMQETRAVDEMRKIIDDNSTNESVKKLAEKGILTLI